VWLCATRRAEQFHVAVSWEGPADGRRPAGLLPERSCRGPSGSTTRLSLRVQLSDQLPCRPVGAASCLPSMFSDGYVRFSLQLSYKMENRR
jgi:hypothetical protein